jgi:hypothetical protein
MAGSFRKLRMVMVYEHEGADLLSVQYPSQRIRPKPLRDNSGRVSGCITGKPFLIPVERVADNSFGTNSRCNF